MAKRNPFLAAALDYAKHGWPVFPVGPDKSPLTKNGHKAASTDPQRIAQWFDRPNPPNIAIVPPEGFAIVDVDPRNGGTTEGLPTTLRAKTGGGGWHYFFRECPSDLPGKLGKGLDLKHNCWGYVVAAPSVHESGKPYKFLGGFDPDRIAPWPVGLYSADHERPRAESSQADLTPSQLRKLLAKISPHDYDDWVAVGQALRESYGADGFVIWLEWSATSAKFPGKADLLKKWRTFKGKGRAIGTLVHMAGGRIDRPEATEEFTTMPRQTLAIEKAADVEEKRIDWLVPGYIANGVLHCVAGYGGEGKSSALSALTAAVSNGKTWIERDPLPAGPSSVAIITEEPFAFQTKPRLRLAGANLDRVFQIKGVYVSEGRLDEWNLVDHEKKTRQFLVDHPDVRLLIIDPIGSYMNGKKREINTWKDSDVRLVLSPWQRLAEETNIAIIYVAHYTKGKAERAMNLVTGSAAFTTVTRMSYAVVEPPTGYLQQFGFDDEGYRILFPTKVNIGRWPQPIVLKFTTVADNDNPRVTVEGILPRIKAEDLLDQMKARDTTRETPLQDRLLAAVGECEGWSKRQIAERAGSALTNEATQDAFDSLETKGLITIVKGERGKPDLVFTTASGLALIFA